MAKVVTRELHNLAIAEGVSLSEVHLRSNQDILFASGPVKWSQEVLAYLSFSTGTEVTYRNFTGLTEHTLVGDVMIMPIKAFATGLVSSGGGSEITEKTLLRYQFLGSWKMRGGEMPAERKKGIQWKEVRKGREGEKRWKGSGGRCCGQSVAEFQHHGTNGRVTTCVYNRAEMMHNSKYQKLPRILDIG